jgi:hypothetical protein
MGSLQQPL